MATNTIQAVSEALKTWYMGPIIKEINEKSGPVFAAMEKKNMAAPGNLFKFPLQYGRHGGLGMRGENDDLPTPSARKYKQAQTEVKNAYAIMAITDKLLKASKSDKMAFVSDLNEQMSNITTDAKDMIRRAICGDHWGVMGTVKTAVTAGKVVTVDGSVECFYEGQVVDILTDASTKSVTAKEIIDVDRDAGTITFADNVSVTAGQKIALTGNYGMELTGLREIFTKGNTLYGIDRSKNSWFNPVYFDKSKDGSPTAFNSLWMSSALTTVENRSGESPAFFVCSDGVKLAYVEEQLTYKRNTEMMKVEGGYNLPTYDGTPISAERYADPNQMMLINMDNFILAQLAPWEWLDNDGAVLSRIANKPAYEATLACYCDIICTKPNSQAIIKGIKEVK